MPFTIEPDRISFDDRGLQNYEWPISRDETRSVRDTALTEVVEVVRGVCGDEPLSRHLRALYPHIAMGAMTMYRGYALRERLTSPLPSTTECSVLESIAAGNVPKESLYVDLLESGIHTSKEWVPELVRQAKWSLRWNGLSLAGFSPINWQSDTVTAFPLDLIERHAKSEDTAVKYRPIDYWFDNLKGEVGMRETQLQSDSLDTFTAAFESAFEAGNETFPSWLHSYVQRWLNELVTVTDAHITNINDNKNVPKNLWTGAGSIWSRILTEVVQENGGRVSFHDHGAGVGFFCPLVRIVTDFEQPDEFVTYNRQIVDLYQRQMIPEVLIDKEPAEITSVPPTRNDEKIVPQSSSGKPSTSVETVMYVSTLYPNERVRMSSLLPDPVVIDWQYRLMARLNEWGYDVLFKPHPDSSYDVTEAFENHLSIEVLTDAFEEVMHVPDAFIFDVPISTTFTTALMTEKPITLVDFDLMDVPQDVRAELGERCEIVDGTFSEDNRAQIDWEEFRTAVKRAPERKDRKFVKKYLFYD